MVLLCADPDNACFEPIAIDSVGPTELDPAAQVIPLPHRRGCALLARGGVTVNGIPALPLHILQGRDEIRAGGRITYYTNDGFPESVVVRFAKPVRCARCLDELNDGEHVIRCPRCHAHHHPDCWTSGNGCQKCGHPPKGLSWMPQPIW